MRYYFISFSNKGENQGCIQIEVNGEEDAAIEIINDLNLTPSYDSIAVYEIKSPEPKLEMNILYTPEELTEKGYQNIKNY
jgi:hypothetical protein